MPRLGGVLKIAARNQQFIKWGVFQEVLENTRADLSGLDRWAAVITKFAVTVCVVYRGGDYIVFDSHGRRRQTLGCVFVHTLWDLRKAPRYLSCDNACCVLSCLGIHPATNRLATLLCFSSSAACGAHLHQLFPETQGRASFPLVQQLQMDSFDFIALRLQVGAENKMNFILERPDLDLKIRPTTVLCVSIGSCSCSRRFECWQCYIKGACIVRVFELWWRSGWGYKGRRRCERWWGHGWTQRVQRGCVNFRKWHR